MLNVKSKSFNLSAVCFQPLPFNHFWKVLFGNEQKISFEVELKYDVANADRLLMVVEVSTSSDAASVDLNIAPPMEVRSLSFTIELLTAGLFMLSNVIGFCFYQHIDASR